LRFGVEVREEIVDLDGTKRDEGQNLEVEPAAHSAKAFCVGPVVIATNNGLLLHVYSSRRATIGSTRMARRAGM
jgi:hypothetical protein